MPRLRLARLRWLWGLRWLWLLLAVGTLPHLLTAGLIPKTLKSNTLWPGSTKSTRPFHVLFMAPFIGPPGEGWGFKDCQKMLARDWMPIPAAGTSGAASPATR
jgi:hypothetical protein